jgi:hypothetical protein
VPQFVQMWFRCDHPGCTAHTEHMVRVYQTSHAAFNVQTDDGAWAGCGTNSGLPPGWHRPLYTDKVLCPDHKEPA